MDQISNETASSSSNDDNTAQSSMSCQQIDLQSLRVNLEQAIESVKKEKQRKEEELNNFRDEMISKIQRQEEKIKTRILQFYTEKQLNINNRYKQLELIESALKLSSNSSQSSHYKLIKRDLIYSLKYCKKKSLYLDPAINDSIGSFKKFFFEMPVKNISKEFKDKPDKIIATNQGFLALFKQQNKIINMETEQTIKIPEGCQIQDISSSCDNKLSYIYTFDDKSSINIAYQDELGWVKKFLYNFEMNNYMYHGVYDENIILHLLSGYVILDKRTCKKLHEFSTEVKKCGSYRFSSKKLYILDLSDNNNFIIVDINTRSEKLIKTREKLKLGYSLYDDFINNVKKGYITNINERFIQIFNQENDSNAIVYQEKIIKDERIIEYYLENDNICICFRNLLSKTQFHIRYFPIF